MSLGIRRLSLVFVVTMSLAALAAGQAPSPSAPSLIDVTVREGTSMSVALSPDGRTLAIDLQGGIWTLPVDGGPARRVTGMFDDARQPTWSPDGLQRDKVLEHHPPTPATP